MGLEAIGEIQSRIDAIQHLVAARLDAIAGAAPAAPMTAAAAAPASSSLGADPASFASVLAGAAQQSGAAIGGTASTDLTSMLGNLATRLSGSALGAAGAGTTTGGFVLDALEQAGKRYQYGASASPADASPPAFDCSELVQWAAARHGVDLPRTAGQQYVAAKQAGDLVPVDQALHTPGALLFSFSSEPVPGGAEPAHAHVAISLGDGRTIEARGRAYGVGTFSAANRFTYGAIIPELTRN